MGFDTPQRFAIGSSIEGDVDSIGILSLVTKHIVAGLQVQISDLKRNLRRHKVRIFSFRRIAGCDHDRPSNKFPAAIGDAGSGAEFSLDILLDDRRARRNDFA